MGGMIPAIERGFPQTEIANASFDISIIETGERRSWASTNSPSKRGADRAVADRRNGAAQQVEKLTEVKAQAENAEGPAIPGCVAARGRGQGKYHAVYLGRGSRLRDAGGNLRCLPRSFRHLYRDRGTIIRTRSQRQLSTGVTVIKIRRLRATADAGVKSRTRESPQFFACAAREDRPPSARPACGIHEASRNRRWLRDGLAILAHPTKVKIDCGLDKLAHFFLRFPSRHTARQIGNIRHQDVGPFS